MKVMAEVYRMSTKIRNTWNDSYTTFNHIYPSYEIYGKLTYNNYTIKALFSDKSIYSFWRTTEVYDQPDRKDIEATIGSENIHFELSHHAELRDTMTLDTKVTAQHIDYTRSKLIDLGTNHGPAVNNNFHQDNYPEKGAGLEFIFNWDINEKNKLLAGTEARVVKAGPGVYQYIDLYTGKGTALNIRYDETTDTTYGIYAEDTFYATDSLTLIGGVRMDYNDPRETDIVVMPRAAVIYNFTDAFTAKYMYNTGYVRPQMDQSYEVHNSKNNKRVTSEKIRAHDIALIYNTDKTQIIFDVYHMKVYDLNTWTGGAYVNAGNSYSQGLELSFKRSFLDGKLVFDLNYGYATAEEEDEFGNKSTSYKGIPNHLYNAGLDYKFTDNIALYANVHGWRELKMNNAITTDKGWVNPNAYQPDD